ncbi:YbaB/EbfC family nucleoid-associated protein [Nocardia sp. NPDC055029]
MVENRLDESIVNARRFAEQLESTAKKYDALQRSMAELSVTARSNDDSVAVTVDSNGVPTAIDLAATTRGKDPAVVSAAIMACLQSAQAKLRDQVTHLVHDVVGNDAPAVDMVSRFAQRFPDPDPGDSSAAHHLPFPDPHTPSGISRPSAAEPAYAPPPVADSAQPWSRRPNREQVVTPDEPDEDEQYYSRKSWLI